MASAKKTCVKSIEKANAPVASMASPTTKVRGVPSKTNLLLAALVLFSIGVSTAP